MWIKIIRYLTIIIFLTGTSALSSCIIDTVPNATCDFESGPCKYQLTNPWIRVSSFSGLFGKNIRSAHDKSKEFIAFNSSSVANGNVTSSNIEGGIYCLSFWYYFTGSEIHLITETSSGLQLANIHDSQSSWKQFSVTVKEQNHFKVIFRVIRGSSFFGKFHSVGIDDILLGVGSCQSPANSSTISFDTQSNSSEVYLQERWTVQSKTFQYRILSISPRTNSTPANQFALFKALKVENNSKDTMTSQCMAPGKYCLNLWINALSSVTECKVLGHTEKDDINIGILNNTKGWTEVALPFSTAANFKIMFHPQVSEIITPSGHHISPRILIGIDDVHIYPIKTDKECELTTKISTVTTATTTRTKVTTAPTWTKSTSLTTTAVSTPETNTTPKIKTTIATTPKSTASTTKIPKKTTTSITTSTNTKITITTPIRTKMTTQNMITSSTTSTLTTTTTPTTTIITTPTTTLSSNTTHTTSTASTTKTTTTPSKTSSTTSTLTTTTTPTTTTTTTPTTKSSTSTTPTTTTIQSATTTTPTTSLTTTFTPKPTATPTAIKTTTPATTTTLTTTTTTTSTTRLFTTLIPTTRTTLTTTKTLTQTTTTSPSGTPTTTQRTTTTKTLKTTSSLPSNPTTTTTPTSTRTKTPTTISLTTSTPTTIITMKTTSNPTVISKSTTLKKSTVPTSKTTPTTTTATTTKKTNSTRSSTSTSSSSSTTTLTTKTTTATKPKSTARTTTPTTTSKIKKTPTTKPTTTTETKITAATTSKSIPSPITCSEKSSTKTTILRVATTSGVTASTHGNSTSTIRTISNTSQTSKNVTIKSQTTNIMSNSDMTTSALNTSLSSRNVSLTTNRYSNSPKGSSYSMSKTSKKLQSRQTLTGIRTTNQNDLKTSQSSPVSNSITTESNLMGNDSPQKAKSRTPIIVGGVIGGLGAFILVFIGVYFYMRYKGNIASVSSSYATDDDMQATFDSSVRRHSNDLHMRQMNGMNSVNNPDYAAMDMQPISNNPTNRFSDRSFDNKF